MFIHTLASNQTGILSLYSVSHCLYPRRLALVPSTGHLLLVYSDWITEAIRGCKLGKLLKRAVCVEAWGTAVMWRDECNSRKLWSVALRDGIRWLYTCACMHIWNSPASAAHNNDLRLWLAVQTTRSPHTDLCCKFLWETVSRATPDPFMMLTGPE